MLITTLLSIIIYILEDKVQSSLYYIGQNANGTTVEVFEGARVNLTCPTLSIPMSETKAYYDMYGVVDLEDSEWNVTAIEECNWMLSQGPGKLKICEVSILKVYINVKALIP